MIKNMFFSITQYERIKVSHYPSLLNIGLGMDGKSKPSSAVKDFVPAAAGDCVIRAQDILIQKGIEPNNPNLSFYDNLIGAGMAHYWESGFNCCTYYGELFFNGLVTVLYGGIGDNAKGNPGQY